MCRLQDQFGLVAAYLSTCYWCVYLCMCVCVCVCVCARSRARVFVCVLTNTAIKIFEKFQPIRNFSAVRITKLCYFPQTPTRTSVPCLQIVCNKLSKQK
jgi:hypothetical protein